MSFRWTIKVWWTKPFACPCYNHLAWLAFFRSFLCLFDCVVWEVRRIIQETSICHHGSLILSIKEAPSIKGWLVSSLLLKSPFLLSPCNLRVASIPSKSLLVYSSQSTFYLQHLILSICPNHLIWHSFSWSQLKISFYLFILNLSFLFLLLHIHLINCIKFISNKMLLVSFVLLATCVVPKATCHFLWEWVITSKTVRRKFMHWKSGCTAKLLDQISLS